MTRQLLKILNKPLNRKIPIDKSYSILYNITISHKALNKTKEINKMNNSYDIYKKTMVAYLGKEADEFLAWLDTTNANVSPSSIRNGCKFEGGWATHCLCVLSKLIAIVKSEFGENFEDVYSKNTIVKVALLSDLYKVNRYEKYLRNVKNEAGQWVQVEDFGMKNDFEQFVNNGLTSVVIANRFFKLTDEEIEAIYYAYPSEAIKANEEYNVGHLADMLRYAIKSCIKEEHEKK